MSDFKTIYLDSQNNYGKLNLYVSGQYKSAIQKLTKKKTVDFDDVLALEELGFKVLMSGRNEMSLKEFLKV